MEAENALRRAKTYPYPRPKESFIFLNGEVCLFNDNMWKGCNSLSDLLVRSQATQKQIRLGDLVEGTPNVLELSRQFTAVLAIGSNGAPDRLCQKFPQSKFPGAVVIPVVRAVLEDFDVVYAPLFAHYGSCPATLEYSPGTCVQLSLTFLTPSLLSHMHSTEGSYNLVQLTDIKLHLGLDLASFRKGATACVTLDSILQYNHQQGSLLPHNVKGLDSPVALQEVPAIGRQYPGMTQTEMLSFLSEYLQHDGRVQEAPLILPGFWSARQSANDLEDVQYGQGASSQALEEWILANIADMHSRYARNDMLSKSTKPFLFPSAKIVANLGLLHIE